MTSNEATNGERTLVALNADIVGYSRLMADDLEATTSAVESHRQLVDHAVSDQGGTLVNFVGDNFMAVFEDAKSAMGAAITITGQVEEFNGSLEPQKQVRFRMGMDQGPVEITDHRYFGDALNIAARIQAIAPEGGIGVSGGVYKALDEPELRFQAIGAQRLKNIPEPVDVYKYLDYPSDDNHTTPRRNLSLESPVIAVLPTHRDEGVPALAPIGEAIREDLIHRLSQVPQLTIVQPDFTDEQPSLGKSPHYMIESGVLEIGDQLRIYVKLVEVATWNVVSSHRWTAARDKVFEVSEGAADEVGRSLEIDLVIGEPGRFYEEVTRPELLQNVYAGWYFLTAGTREGWAKSVENFRVISKESPEIPTGHVLESFALWVGAAEGFAANPERMLLEAYEKALIGAGLDDPTGLSAMVEAAVLMQQGRHDDAMERVENAEIVRPTCDVTYALEGSMRRYMGEWDRAVDVLDTAMRLTAINKPWYPTVQACSLFMGGRLDQAAATAEAVLEVQPNNLEALLVLTGAQVEMGLERRANATAESVRRRYPSTDISEWIDRNPYRDPAMVAQWKRDLASVGLIDAV